MSPWENLLKHPHHRDHLVQLYQADTTSLTRNVNNFVVQGIRRGDGVLLIVTPEHWELFRAGLDETETDCDACLRSRQLVYLDAQETLSRLLVAGQPDWRLFDSAARQAMREVQPLHPDAGLRAYGEMVGLLWQNRQYTAAIRLEQFWNKLLEQCPFSLFCSYGIDVFSKDFHAENLDAVLCTHTHLVPAEAHGHLDTALNLAMDEILGSSAAQLKVLIRANYRPSWAVVPDAEATVLWLRKNLPQYAEAIVERSREHFQSFLQTSSGSQREVRANEYARG